MRIEADNPQDYINQLPQERQEAMIKLREVILRHLPPGFEETMSYGMIGYVVPHSIYPAGYHTNPKLPLPFMNIASQKNFVALYHMGIYADTELLDWFKNQYPNYSQTKLDMGKSCIRFKKIGTIPYDLIGELVERMNVDNWVKLYDKSIIKKPNVCKQP